MSKIKELGSLNTVGQLKEVLSNYPNATSFGFRNQPMQELVEVHLDNESFVVFQEKASTKNEVVKMKYKDALIGARFKFIGDDVPKDVYVKINAYDDGLVVKWNGNVEGHQSHCSWLDEENGYDFNTEIELV